MAPRRRQETAPGAAPAPQTWTDCSGTTWCTSTRAAVSVVGHVLVEGEELWNAAAGVDLSGLVAVEDVPVQLQNQRPWQLTDFVSGMTLRVPAVLTEQLAPVGPHVQPDGVL